MAEPPIIRCAVYTRKSSEEGLDQAFNSLDAQREACAAYILSQRHEGWTLVPEIYEDGGFSGGSMNRPGLQHLLADMEAGKIDVILVYKVDRLTRSLADFAKMVEILDASNASFVSITQAFNTTTSMGRLTLNVLLSFAQFEREVTGERIRDKIAASRKKGMWMGGTVPFGYRAIDRRLVVDEDEATVIRNAMQRYVELRSIRLLADELKQQGVCTRLVQLNAGGTRGGVPFGRGGLRHMLQNRLYLGEVEHKGERYPGEHDAIVAPELWQQVQDVMVSATRERKQGTRGIDPSLLSGLVTDGHGRLMSPSHAVKAAKRYRYYITHPRHIAVNDPAAWRMPAHDLERGVIELVVRFLNDGHALGNAFGGIEPDQLQREVNRAAADASSLISTIPSAVRNVLVARIAAIQLTDTGMTITIKLDDIRTHTLHASVAKLRRSNDVTLRFEPKASDDEIERDEQLVGMLAEAYTARKAMVGSREPIGAVANKLGIGTARFKRLLRISYLAPSIVDAILDGQHPSDLTLVKLNTITNIPHDWDAQRALLGFA